MGIITKFAILEEEQEKAVMEPKTPGGCRKKFENTLCVQCDYGELVLRTTSFVGHHWEERYVCNYCGATYKNQGDEL
jgi:hypothetical protein